MKDNEEAFNQELDGANATNSTTLGIDPLQDQADINNQAGEQDPNSVDTSDPYGVKKRLGMQAKKHAKEMKQMRDEIAQLRTQQFDPNQTNFHAEPTNPFPSPGQPGAPGQSQEEMLRNAMTYALQMKQH